MTSGFTILEVLLALSITALVMAALSPAMVGALRAQRQAREAVDQAAVTRRALAQWREDLTAAPLPTGSCAQPLVLTAGDTESAQLEVTTWSPVPWHPQRVSSLPTTGQAVVTWSVGPADDGQGLALRRAAATELLATGTVPEATPVVVLEHLAQCTMSVTASDGTRATAWSSSDHDQALPLTVTLTWAWRAPDGAAGPAHTITVGLPMGGSAP